MIDVAGGILLALAVVFIGLPLLLSLLNTVIEKGWAVLGVVAWVSFAVAWWVWA